MQCSLWSSVGVCSPATHQSTVRYMLFNLPRTPGELFHKADDTHSVLGRRSLKITRLARMNIMTRWLWQSDKMRPSVLFPVVIVESA